MTLECQKHQYKYQNLSILLFNRITILGKNYLCEVRMYEMARFFMHRLTHIESAYSILYIVQCTWSSARCALGTKICVSSRTEEKERKRTSEKKERDTRRRDRDDSRNSNAFVWSRPKDRKVNYCYYVYRLWALWLYQLWEMRKGLLPHYSFFLYSSLSLWQFACN